MPAPDPVLTSTLHRHRRGAQRPLLHHLAYLEDDVTPHADVEPDLVLEVIDGPLGAFLSLKVSDPSGVDLGPAALRTLISAAQEALMVIEHADNDHGLQVAA